MPADIRGLLLCGGLATRFGGDKLTFDIAPARGAGEPRAPMAALAARNLVAGAGNALAVIPSGAGALRSILEAEGCEILESRRTLRGLGESLGVLRAGAVFAMVNPLLKRGSRRGPRSPRRARRAAAGTVTRWGFRDRCSPSCWRSTATRARARSSSAIARRSP